MDLKFLLSLLKNVMFRKFGFPKQTPMLINFVVTYRCNSRCRTCNIWKRKNSKNNEFTLDEFKEFISKNDIWWIAYTGGEPFLRNDLVDIWLLADMNFSITTNGILTKRIVSFVERFVKESEKLISVNVSIDGNEKVHNFVRGINCYKKAMKTYKELKKLSMKYKNVEVYISSTISKFNLHIFREFVKRNYDKKIVIRPAVFLEYYKLATSPSPWKKELINLLRFLEKQPNIVTDKQLIRFWEKYYMNPRHLIDCYSGWSSVWIDPYWNVFPCVGRENFKIGNLRKVEFELKKLWFNSKIKAHRRFVKKTKCHCSADCENINSLRHNLGYLLRRMINL